MTDTTRGPTLAGPVSGGRHGWPFGSSLDNLAAVGYVEEEYFLEGRAPAYRAVGVLGSEGRWTLEEADTAPFRTRVLVQRPVSPERFNGTVVVGWNNVTAGYELISDLPAMLEEGFAFAAVSAQKVGVDGIGPAPEGLRAWDPERYGTLEHPGDRFSYGIFTEATRAFGPRRSPDGDPLGGLDVSSVLAVGGSQSAARLATYINGVQPLEGAFDGFLVLIHFGAGTAVDDDDAFDPNAPAPRSIFHARTALRDDLGVPVMVVNSETETLAYAASRQPDTDLFRFWEVAGASHVSGPQLPRRAVKAARDGVTMRDSPAPSSEISYVPAASAALAHLKGWAAGGPPPPVQPRIEVAGDPPAIGRDRHDNALGGVRMPGVEVPVAHNTGVSPVPGLGGLGGGHRPFDRQTLVDLYGTPERYVAAFTRAADKAVEAGVIRRSEADGLVDEARRFHF